MAKPKRGRSIVGGFVALANAYLRTPEFAALSGKAVKLLLELAMQYNRSNNGDLALTRSVLAPRGWRSMDSLQKARDELINAGWIMVTRQGGRNIPTLYALTWEPIDRCGGKLDVAHDTMPSHLWKTVNAKHREVRLHRPPEQVAPPAGTTLHRRPEQGPQH